MRTPQFSAVFGILSALIAPLNGSFEQPQTVTVRGIVFDSLAMAPSAGAAVWISGSAHIATTDNNGRFEIRGVERGKRFVEFSSPALDSLELGSLGIQLNLSDQNTVSVALTTPSFRTLWRTLCSDHIATSPDSGIVWGVVRDAATGARLRGARVVTSWVLPQVTEDFKIEYADWGSDVESDSLGNYYSCGLPVEKYVSMQAIGARALSGILQVSTTGRRLARLDLEVSPEVAFGTSVRDSTVAGNFRLTMRRGSAQLRGTVRDERGEGVSGVTVTSSATDTIVQTDASGAFAFPPSSAGTHQVEFRRTGYLPVRTMLHLRPGVANELSPVLSSLTGVEALGQKSGTASDRDRQDFELRREAGYGFALDGKLLSGKSDLKSVLSVLPTAIVQGDGGIVSVRPAIAGRVNCAGTQVYVDGVQSRFTEASNIAVADLRGVEWYARSHTAPARYADIRYCSLIMFWTRESRWGSSR